MGETIPADHHEPAEGDEVHVAPISKDRARVLFDAAVRAAYDDGANAAKRGMQTAACSALRSIASALGMSADALPGAIVERVERIAIEHGDEARDLAALLAAADHVDATARAAEGAGPAEREAAREARHELRRVVAELRAGVPAGVLVSREDAAVVRAVLAAAERGHAIAGEGREGDAWDESGLEDAVCDYERAGRPLASKEA